MPSTPSTTSLTRPRQHVLLIDDREGEYLLVKRLLNAIPDRPYQLHWASTAEEALRLVDEFPDWHALLIDYSLGDARTGLDLLQDLKAACTKAPIIMLTVVTDPELDHRCMRAGAADYLVKSELSASHLHRAMAHAVERQVMRLQLERSESRYRGLADHLPKGAVLVTDSQGRCISAHGSGLGELGIDPQQAPGAQLRQLLPDDLAEQLNDQLERSADGLELSFESTIGNRIYLVHLCPLPSTEDQTNCQVVLQNVTELRSAERAVVQSSRLASIGTLAGGLAHEFNNIHSLLLGHIERLHRSISDDAELSGRVDVIRQGVWRAAEVTRNLLSFARGCRSTLALTPLHELVEETLRLVAHEYAAAGIEFELRLADLPPLWMQPAGISQVLINLLINARQAMEQQAEQRIVITTGSEAGSVFLRLEDTGRGMTAEQLRQAFDPFFSTKTGELGGTGLGLTVCRTIIANHGGEIMAASTPGVGSTFTIHLPLRSAGADELPVDESGPLRAVDAPGSTGTIMVVDDDQELRALLDEVLADHGWQVLQAGDGVEALDQLRSHHVDLVLVDLHMPRCDGWTFVEALRAHHDPPSVVITSGHLDGAPGHEQDQLIEAFLAKPFTLDRLCRTVARCLHQRAGYRPR